MENETPTTEPCPHLTTITFVGGEDAKTTLCLACGLLRAEFAGFTVERQLYELDALRSIVVDALAMHFSRRR